MLPRARTDQLYTEKIGRDTVVYDRKTEHAHTLTAAAALVWRRCDGKTTIPQLAAALSSDLGLPADEEIVWLAIDFLARADLMQTGDNGQALAAMQRRRERARHIGQITKKVSLADIDSSSR